MAKKAYIGGANGEARKLKNIYVRPDSGVVHRKVKKVYIGVNGVAEQCYQSDMTATSASVSALNYTFNQSVTIVDVCYGGGYWFAVGYNSSRIYIAFATSLTGMWNSWYWNVDSAIPTAIAYADGYVWITVDEESNTKNYNLLRFAVNDIVSGGTTDIFIHDNYTYYDMASDGTNTFAVGWAIARNCLAWQYTSEATRSEHYITGVTKKYTKCCVYKAMPFMISTDGSVIGFSGMTGGRYDEMQLDSGLTTYCLAEMNGYLVIAGTKSDGTYVYYTSGSNYLPYENVWACQKITSEVVTPKSLSYANGKCVLAYEKNGSIYLATATSPEGHWTFLSGAVSQFSGYTFGEMASGNGQICILAHSGATIRIGEVT